MELSTLEELSNSAQTFFQRGLFTLYELKMFSVDRWEFFVTKLHV